MEGTGHERGVHTRSHTRSRSSVSKQEVTESFASLARAAVIAIFLIYIVLVIRFQSMTQPMLIILAIPMSLIGSTWGLVLSGNALGFTAFLGMISLTGIVVNDSIVLLDYINTLAQARIAAGRRRRARARPAACAR